jgi:RNA polymerase sigma-70 factor (ECF subfamily)
MSSLLNKNAEPSDYIDGSEDVARASDASLVRLIASNQESALSELYDRHALSVFNYLRRLVKNQEVAEDLLQETYIAIWQGAVAFKGRSSVKTWIFRIAHNLAVSWLRKMHGLKAKEQKLLEKVDGNPEYAAINNWKTEQLQAAIDELSAEHRSVIELAFVQELSYSEIAKVIDRPVGTVKSRISYALRRLGGLLKRQGLNG